MIRQKLREVKFRSAVPCLGVDRVPVRFKVGRRIPERILTPVI